MATSRHSRAGHVAFVHDWAADAAKADTVVALTPLAFEAALSAGAQPTVLDDHVDRGPLIDRARTYLRWQHDWLRRVDDVAGGRGAVLAGALYLTWPVNSVVMQAWLLREAVKSLAPERITYFGLSLGTAPDPDPLHAGHLQFWPSLGDGPLASRLLPLVAAALDVPCAEQSTSRPEKSRPAGQSREAQLRLWLARRRNIPGVNRRRPQSTLLLWTAGYGVRRLASRVTRSGRTLLILERRRPTTRLLRPRPWGFHPMTPPVSLAVTQSGELPAGVYALLEEVDAWSGTPGTAAVLRDRFRVFVGGICSAIDRVADSLEPVFPRFGIAQVAAANPASIEEFGALLAASRRGDVERVLAQHGDQLFPVDSWFSEELQNFDVVLTSDASLLDDVPAAAAALGVEAPKLVLESPRVEVLRHRAGEAAARGRAARTICYLPCFLVGDAAVPDGAFFDDAWYHRWHRRLLTYFASRTDVQVIWKALPSSDQNLDPMPQLIAGSGPANVRYETVPFQKLLADVDAVITDFPSTGLYEAVHFDKPVLALVFPRFARIRPGARRLFDTVIRECDDEEDALAAIATFLDDEPARWRVRSEAILPSPASS